MKRFYLFPFILFQVYRIQCTQPKIIIIGAGSSGIAAATHLWEHNFTNIQILEAENRIGGRINTVKFGNAFVDLGAEWCHGEIGNIVYEKVKDLNLLEHYQGTELIYHSSRTHLGDEFRTDFLNLTYWIYSNIWENPPENKSIGELLNER